MDKKTELQEILKENKKSFAILLAGIVLSIILKIIDSSGFLGGIGILIIVATIGYGIFIFFSINIKKKEVETKKVAEEEETRKAEALRNFENSIEVNIDKILIVIADDPSTKNFELGLEQIINNSAASLTMYDVLPLAHEFLLSRMKKATGHNTATSVLVNYFKESMYEVLLNAYLPLAVFEENMEKHEYAIGRHNEKKIPFVKVLYGFSVRIWNYKQLQNSTGYKPVDMKLLKKLVETNEVISSFCKDNPFEVEEKQREWVNDIKDAAYKATSSNRLKINLENDDELLEKLCYEAYCPIENNDGEELVCIAANLIDTVKADYQRIRSNM